MSEPKMVIVVNLNIPEKWYIPQSAHAGMQYCIDHPLTDGWRGGTVVILGAPKREFKYLLDVAARHNYRHSVFFEPFANKNTAMAYICKGDSPMAEIAETLDLLGR
jgi:hypothetical protein